MRHRELAVFASVVFLAMPGAAKAEDAMQQGQPSVQQQNISAETEKDIRYELGYVLKEALDGDMGNIVDRLAKSDRDRLKDADQDDLALDTRAIERFNDKWENQFPNKDITESQIPYMVSAVPGSGPEQARGRLGTRARDYHSQASVTVPAVQGLETQLNLVNEGTVTSAWRINIPDNVTGQHIQQSLNTAFNQLNNETLPNDERRAASVVAAHIFKALSGQGSSKP